jgi:hypothetical protein
MKMELSGYTTQSLERLSTDELVVLAEQNGLDIASGLERALIIEELVHLDRNDVDKNGEDSSSTVLPRQQGFSMIEVLVRDPLWAFVFWEIRNHDQILYENTEDFEGYCLRVLPIKEDTHQPDMAASFTVDVGAQDNSWYLGFPPDSGCFFMVELCVCREEHCTVLASSRPFKMPRLIETRRSASGETQALYQNPLAELSGVDRFSLLRSMDRQIRPRTN